MTDEQRADILRLTAAGEPLTRICKLPGMPSRPHVYVTLDKDQEFAAEFEVARTHGVHALAEECLEIADEPLTDHPSQVPDKRVRIDTRLRLAGKWRPKEYGDKIDATVKGSLVAEVIFRGLNDDDGE